MTLEELREIPVVILAGGKGTRLGSEYGLKPKPLVCIGPLPILMHIILIYMNSGFRKFFICVGFRSGDFQDYFESIGSKVSTNFYVVSKAQLAELISPLQAPSNDFDIEIKLLDTGVESTTAKRIKMAIDEFDSNLFCATYGDGVASLDVSEVLNFHIQKRFDISLTAFHPPSRFGEVMVNANNLVVNFQEKQLSSTLVNGGFFIINRSVQDDIDPELSLEVGLLGNYCRNGKLGAYISEDFWQMMDTPREVEILNEMYERGSPPWLTSTLLRQKK